MIHYNEGASIDPLFDMNSKSFKLFSLIELLVVFALMGILISLLQPSLSKMIKSADTLACANNLHHFYKIFMFYTEDNDDLFTPYGAEGTGPFTNYMWFTRLENYHDQLDQVRLCPSTTVTKTIWGTTDTAWNWGGRAGSYAFNAYFHSIGYTKTHEPIIYSDSSSYFRKLSRVTRPAETGMLADSSWVDAWPDNSQVGPVTASLGGQSGESSMARLCVNRHEWATNVLKADGSVRKHVLEELWTDLYWHRTSSPKSAPTINP